MTQTGGLSDRMVSIVAERKGAPEGALPKLYESIDPEALEELIEHGAMESDTEVFVRFSYAGVTVNIRDSGDISLEE